MKSGFPDSLCRIGLPQLRPGFFQPFYAHGLRRAQFLGEEADAKFFQQPAEFLQALIHHALALGQQARVALLQRLQFFEARQVTRRVGAVFVEPRGDGFQVAREVMQAGPGRDA